MENNEFTVFVKRETINGSYLCDDLDNEIGYNNDGDAIVVECDILRPDQFMDTETGRIYDGELQGCEMTIPELYEYMYHDNVDKQPENDEDLGCLNEQLSSRCENFKAIKNALHEYEISLLSAGDISDRASQSYGVYFAENKVDASTEIYNNTTGDFVGFYQDGELFQDEDTPLEGKIEDNDLVAVTQLAHAFYQKTVVENQKIYAYAPAGYNDGSLITVECETRKGMPALDIVGIADSYFKEMRGKLISAVKNSGFEFPQKRVLIALTPCDMHKDGEAMALPIAIANLCETKDIKLPGDVLCIGDLMENGQIMKNTYNYGCFAAAQDAIRHNVEYIICDTQTTQMLIKNKVQWFDAGVNCKILGARSLQDVVEKIRDINNFIEIEPNKEKREIDFDDDVLKPRGLTQDVFNAICANHGKQAEILAIAAAGHHNVLIKDNDVDATRNFIHAIPFLTPKLTEQEAQEVLRIWSLSSDGMQPSDGIQPVLNRHAPDVHMPDTSFVNKQLSLEVMAGTMQHPGLASLAHNGNLIIPSIEEMNGTFRSVLSTAQRFGHITISRAGRTFQYPSQFTLVASAKNTEESNKKLDRPPLHFALVSDFAQDNIAVSLKDLRKKVATAYTIARKRGEETGHGIYNNDIPDVNIVEKCQLLASDALYVKDTLKTHDIAKDSPRAVDSLKVALTVANMDGRDFVTTPDIAKALYYNGVTTQEEYRQTIFTHYLDKVKESVSAAKTTDLDTVLKAGKDVLASLSAIERDEVHKEFLAKGLTDETKLSTFMKKAVTLPREKPMEKKKVDVERGR